MEPLHTLNLDAMSEAVHYQQAITDLVVNKLANAPGPVLDHGAGKGEYAQRVARQLGVEVLCVEPETRLHAQYAANLRPLAQLSDIPADVPIASAYSLNVFEHIAADVDALKDLSTRMAPGGSIFILVPANPDLWTHMDQAVGHVRRYTPLRLKALASLSGLEVVEEGWFDRTGYLATRVLQYWSSKGLQSSAWDGRITPWQVYLFDQVFHVLEPIFSTLRLPFGKNRWLLARKPLN